MATLDDDYKSELSAAKTPSLETQLGDMARAISDLSVTVDNLTDALSPILAKEAKSVIRAGMFVDTNASPISIVVAKNETDLRNIDFRLCELILRLNVKSS